jgi:hypothetical protein
MPKAAEWPTLLFLFVQVWDQGSFGGASILILTVPADLHPLLRILRMILLAAGNQTYIFGDAGTLWSLEI